MAVKVFPHSVGNIKPDVAASGMLQFRWPQGETRDPYYIVGTTNGGANNKHLLWIEIQHLSHPYGKARSCHSCHQQKQIARSRWEFFDEQGTSDSLTGGYMIEADGKGLRVIDLKPDRPVKADEGFRLEDFAAWLSFPDHWVMPGDYAVKADRKKFYQHLGMARRIDRKVKRLDARFSKSSTKEKRRYAELKGIVLHNTENALEMLEDFEVATGTYSR